jgi:hypothetical protein
MKNTLTLAIAIATLACASENTPADKQPVDGMITLKLKITPDDAPPVIPVDITRATTPGTPEETRIATLRLFIFKSDNNTLEKYHHLAIDTAGASTDPAWNAAEKALHLIVTPGPKRLYCIANWSTTPTVEMPDISDRTITDTATLLAVTRAHTGNPLINPPVMSGRLTRVLAANDRQITIPMTRQVAKIQIIPMITPTLAALGADIKIEGIRFSRLPPSSFVFERDLAQSIVAGNWEQTTYTGTTSTAITATTPAAATPYPHAYHLPEHVAASPAAITLMIIKALYNGQTTYYTVPTGAPADTLHATRRDRLYTYYLTIQGTGSPVAVITRAPTNPSPAFTNIRREIIATR